MKPIFLIAVLCSWIQAQAPAPHRFGAIDGVTIPDQLLNVPRETAADDYLREQRYSQQSQSQPPSERDIQRLQQNRLCRNLQGSVRTAATDRAKRELGIFATDAEVAAKHAQVPSISDSSEEFMGKLGLR
jgi:hypothetical protein